MTTVVGVVTGDHVVMGADAQGSAGGVVRSKTTKVYRAGAWLIGFCGNARVGTVVSSNLAALEPATTADDMALRLRQLVTDDGCQPERSGGHPDYDLSFLVARGPELYHIGASFEVSLQWGCAIGSGFEIALGALHMAVKLEPELPAETLVHRVLGVAETLDIYTGGPFHVLSTEADNEGLPPKEKSVLSVV